MIWCRKHSDLAGRTDLIGFDKKCLIRPRQIKGRDFAAGGYKGAHHGSQTAKPAAANRAKDAKRPAVGGMTGHKQTGVNGNGRNAEGFGGAVGGKSKRKRKEKNHPERAQEEINRMYARNEGTTPSVHT